MTTPELNPEDDLVTLVTKSNEMEAGAVQAVLEDAGITAFVFSTAQNTLPLAGALSGVPVQVRHADLERARAAIAQNIADSVDLDWDEVDVGQREDDVPIAHRAGMPLVARVGQIFVAVILAIIVISAVSTGFLGIAGVIVLGVLLWVFARKAVR